MKINYDIKLGKPIEVSGDKLDKEINKILRKVISRIERIMFIKKSQGKIKSGMTLKEFVDNNAGLFLNDILTGFLKKGIIDRNSYIKMTKDSFYKKELSLLAQIKDAYQDTLANADAGYILKYTGNLDQRSATRIFNDIMKD